FSGKDAGEIGFTDFTFRSDYSYGEPELVNATKIRTKTLYDDLAAQKKRVCLISLPITYPPLPLPDGVCISGFIAPDTEHEFTHPHSEKETVKKLVGDYILDASMGEKNYRQLDKKQALDRIFDMDRQRFVLANHYLKGNFDFLLVHLLGTDRIGHLFSRYSEKSHVFYEPGTPYSGAILDHLKFVDEELGKILKRTKTEPDTTVVVASDHGLNPLDGRINLNEWLIQEGFMELIKRPDKPVGVSRASVNWDRTQAWTMGFMGARIYLNVKGREKLGIVQDYDAMRSELEKKLKTLKDDHGRPLNVDVLKKEDIFHGPHAGPAPDLFVQMNDYRWSNNALIGYDSLYSYNTTLGVDDGVHSLHGIFLAQGDSVPHTHLEQAEIFDVAHTLYRHFGIRMSEPRNAHGSALF
ncbi:MAG TPA: alkaline phosphatase family protein, partial [Candidatus Norongarragalinales archaeon]|nr:alkaline phosphatase family protein [Candidatus Norongarragalinales archaeon]